MSSSCCTSWGEGRDLIGLVVDGHLGWYQAVGARPGADQMQRRFACSSVMRPAQCLAIQGDHVCSRWRGVRCHGLSRQHRGDRLHPVGKAGFNLRRI